MSILLLLKPWQNIVMDLKMSNETWVQSFDRFLNQLTSGQRCVENILSGIQYFHNCQGSVEKDANEFTVSGDLHLQENDNPQIRLMRWGIGKRSQRRHYKVYCAI